LKEYTEPQRAKFVELAQKIGIGRAIKELGYPSWPTGREWCQARGVVPAVDTLMQEVKKFHTFYETTDALLIAEEGFERVRDKLLESNLDADELKKTAEAFQKFVNTWQVLQGKASTITESHSKDSLDLELIDLLNAEKARSSVSDVTSRGLSKVSVPV
jgi:hypothetical protein